MNRPKQPCERDCPNRSAECRKTCEPWQEYEKLYKVFFEQKTKEKDIACYVGGLFYDSIEAHKKGRRRKRKK